METATNFAHQYIKTPETPNFTEPDSSQKAPRSKQYIKSPETPNFIEPNFFQKQPQDSLEKAPEMKQEDLEFDMEKSPELKKRPLKLKLPMQKVQENKAIETQNTHEEKEIETGEISPGHVQRMKSAFESPQISVNNGYNVHKLKNAFESPQISVRTDVSDGRKNRSCSASSTSSAYSSISGKSTNSSEAENIVLEAQRLKFEALQRLEETEEDLHRAQQAQEEAAKAAERANLITIYALNKEVQGQEKLIQAGHKLMEAGAKLQAEAACIGKDRHALINVHQKNQIRQETRTQAPMVPPQATLKVHQAREIQLFGCSKADEEVVHEKLFEGKQREIY